MPIPLAHTVFTAGGRLREAEPALTLRRTVLELLDQTVARAARRTGAPRASAHRLHVGRATQRNAQAPLRSHTASQASIRAVPTNFISYSERESFLLELLHFAGWQLQIRRSAPARIRATRDGVEVDVSGSSLSEAAGIAFARAMRSGQSADRSEGA